MFGFGLQLPLPHTVTERMWHSISAIQLSPNKVLLVAFGGSRSFRGDNLSHTTFVQLSMYCIAVLVIIVTDTAQCMIVILHGVL